ncbi:MAG TPA: isoleucine--tRNA ligase, partial [Dehalococcoidia bacterium]|nr:isoleucine--tRNA ligase [Dehalococcoidia bacterium]
MSVFKPVSSKVDFPAMEEEALRFWKQRDIFRKSLKVREGQPLFSFYEGPPTANGSPGIHHVLARVFKDVIPRYRTMKGFYVPRKGGWDTHGLPVEIEVEKELGFSGKPDIERYGVDRFNARCRESVFRYVKEWESLTDRIGFWIDLEHAYITYENYYIESGWWIIRRFWDQGLVYQDYKVTPHCPRCGTSLSSHEVALGYKDDTEDPSVYVRFRVQGQGSRVKGRGSSGVAADVPVRPAGSGSVVQGESSGVGATLGGRPDAAAALPTALAEICSAERPCYLLAWTTTPWTLTGNVALAVAPEEEYVVVDDEGGRLILARALTKQVLGHEPRVLATVKGSELAGLEYEPLYQFLPLDRPAHRVVAGDFVAMNEGTGIVHIAPAFGEVDLEIGRANAFPVLQTVDLRGNFVPEVTPWAGMWVKDADPLIIEDLRSRGLLYRSGRITHTYPFCWRCDTALLYYVKTSWYIKTTARKDRLLAANEQINWYPGHIKYGRFGDWLQNNVDWAISRERYWGTPLPIWKCEDCGQTHCVGSIAELRELSGDPRLEDPVFDLHRPYVDDIGFPCKACGGGMRRLPEVLDCWFDSGAMPVAQWHYPFEDREAFQKTFPADFISEAVDQTRGWFYSLHALAVLLFDSPAYRNVICLGLVLDARGEKMSKSRGNVVDPWTVLKASGADALRWYLYTAGAAGNPRRFSGELVDEVVRRFLLTLWNTYSFFVIYANIDRWHPRRPTLDPRPSNDLDRWVLSELNVLVEEVTNDLENYNPTDAGRAVQDFLEGLSNWYVRRSRRRFWKSENDADKMAAYATLYHCLVTLAKLLAPFTPFLAEEMYQNLVRSVDPESPESVHLAGYPVADTSLVEQRLMEDTRLVMKVSSLGRAARS